MNEQRRIILRLLGTFLSDRVYMAKQDVFIKLPQETKKKKKLTGSISSECFSRTSTTEGNKQQMVSDHILYLQFPVYSVESG